MNSTESLLKVFLEEVCHQIAQLFLFVFKDNFSFIPWLSLLDLKNQFSELKPILVWVAIVIFLIFFIFLPSH